MRSAHASPDKIREVKGKPGKHDRSDAVKQILDDLLERAGPAGHRSERLVHGDRRRRRTRPRRSAASSPRSKSRSTREAILAGMRPDGRGYNDIRPITCEVGVLPRVHGSAVFSRGETQALCTVTLGTSSDEQLVDGLIDEYSQKFMLDYNFPSFSVGEVRPIRGPGRREIGHGALAERSLDRGPARRRAVPLHHPRHHRHPRVQRLQLDGSASAAACLALMDAGVPITKPVAGISIGLVKEGDKYVLLTDIIGDEDHFGDMDFKVCRHARRHHRASSSTSRSKASTTRSSARRCTAPSEARLVDPRQDGRDDRRAARRRSASTPRAC